MTPLLTKQLAVFLFPVPSIQPWCATSPSPLPSTQPHHATPTHPIRQRGVATQHGKPTTVKKTAVDQLNDSCQEETCYLNLEHNKKMASIHLKKHKYDLWYGSTPQKLGSPTLVVATQTKEDKQIEILYLQIRLAELTQDNSACASLSQMPHNFLDSWRGVNSKQWLSKSTNHCAVSYLFSALELASPIYKSSMINIGYKTNTFIT